MTQKSVPLTPDGLRRLQEELEFLKTDRRQQVFEELKRAKDAGRASANAELQAARDDQGRIEGRIRQLENILRSAKVIAPESAPPQFVKLGSRVTLADLLGNPVQYEIVGSMEANPRQGRISNESPVGRALLGRRVGEQVAVLAPGGVINYTVVAIE